MVHGHRWWTTYLKQIWPFYLVVLAAFGLGILLGSLGVNTLPQGQTHALQGLIESFLVQAPDLNPDRAQMAMAALGHNLFWGAAIYICGLTIICLPLILAFIFTRGFTLGFTVGFLSQGAGEGTAVALISMLPQNILFIPALIIGGAASLSFSLLLLRRFFNSGTRIWPSFAGYTAIMMGVLVVFALAALTEAYITPDITRYAASFLID